MFDPNQRHVSGRTVPNLVQNYLKDLNIVWDVQQQFEEKQDNL
jgi:hypothetical protein